MYIYMYYIYIRLYIYNIYVYIYIYNAQHVKEVFQDMYSYSIFPHECPKTSLNFINIKKCQRM